MVRPFVSHNGLGRTDTFSADSVVMTLRSASCGREWLFRFAQPGLRMPGPLDATGKRALTGLLNSCADQDSALHPRGVLSNPMSKESPGDDIKTRVEALIDGASVDTTGPAGDHEGNR